MLSLNLKEEEKEQKIFELLSIILKNIDSTRARVITVLLCVLRAKTCVEKQISSWIARCTTDVQVTS